MATDILERHLAVAGIGAAPPDLVTLTGLIVARLCHDLAGGVSACVSGAELLADEDDREARADLADALAIAASRLAARVRFCRFVFGIGDETAAFASAEALRLLAELFAERPQLRIDWRLSDGPIMRGRLRLLLALALALSENAAVGVMSIEHRCVTLTAHNAKLTPELRGAFNGANPLPTPKIAVALFAAAAAEGEGYRIVAECGEGWIKLAIV